MMIPVIAMTAVMTRTRRLQPRNCPKKLLNAIRVRRCHQVRCVVPLTCLVFIDVLAGENAQEIAKKVDQIAKKSTKNADKATKNKNKGSESDSSDADSSDSDSSLKSPASDSSDAESSSSGPRSSSSSDSSDEDEANANKKAPKDRTQTTQGKRPSTSESSSESEDDSESESQREEDMHVTKKRKTSENGAAVTTAVAAGSQEIARGSQGKEKPPPNVKERFQRVKVQNFTPELLLNNGYEARVGDELSPASGAFTTVTGRDDERLWWTCAS